MNARRCFAKLLLSGLLITTVNEAAAQMTATLRGREGRTVEVEQYDASGVIGEFADSRVYLTWDRVQSIEGANDEQVAAYLTAGEHLWRGLARLDRGDPIAALEALEVAFETFEDEPGATAELAADALLDARLSISIAQRCVLPWLHVLERDATQLGRGFARRAVIDEQWGLVPQLAPIFVPSRQSGRVAADVAADEFGRWTIGPTRRLAEVYASALLIAAGEAPPPLDWEPSTQGVRLARAVVEARSGDPRRRAVARDELQEFLQSDDRPWVKAWCHAAIGLSLLEESERERLAGVGHLLVVPSVHGETQPYLAGLCLASAAEALADV
ncbi:MAG: hypothetical protein AAFY46_15790, partial [Planctomycetota bacterium]